MNSEEMCELCAGMLTLAQQAPDVVALLRAGRTDAAAAGDGDRDAARWRARR